MPNYRVRTTRLYYSTIIYEVTAENEDEALATFDDYDKGKQVSLSSPDWNGEEEVDYIEEI